MKRLMILAALVAAVGCGDDSSSGDDGDDGSEETPRDAGRDAGSGAGRNDAGKADAGKADASTGSADAGKADAGGGGGDDCDALTYADYGKGFMDKYCASCHAASKKDSARMGAPADEIFDTLAQIKAEKAALKKSVVDDESMPFPTSRVQPTADERAEFGAWLDCGPN